MRQPPLCRRHHRAKDEGGWRLDRASDDTCTWTSPAGQTYRVTPAQQLAEGIPGRPAAWTETPATARATGPTTDTAAASAAGPLSPGAATGPGAVTSTRARVAAATAGSGRGAAVWDDEEPPF